MERALEAGGWPYSMGSHQCATEPTALAILAGSSRHDVLAQTQKADGGWAPIHPGAGAELTSGWATSLATIALLRKCPSDPALQRALRWLCGSRGVESHWLWRWKFKLADTQVSFNPDKFGWSWAPGTASWVIPTAFALIALRLGLQHGQVQPGIESRLRIGTEMLIDRACPGGGWNAGNSRVFGVALAPNIDATAIALLALQGSEMQNELLISQSLGELLARTSDCPGASSLAWSLLALHAWRRYSLIHGELAARVEQLEHLLQSLDRLTDNSTLAVSVLALDAVSNNRNLFEARS